jgi:hypothetical protein
MARRPHARPSRTARALRRRRELFPEGLVDAAWLKASLKLADSLAILLARSTELFDPRDSYWQRVSLATRERLKPILDDFRKAIDEVAAATARLPIRPGSGPFDLDAVETGFQPLLAPILRLPEMLKIIAKALLVTDGHADPMLEARIAKIAALRSTIFDPDDLRSLLTTAYRHNPKIRKEELVEELSRAVPGMRGPKASSQELFRRYAAEAEALRQKHPGMSKKTAYLDPDLMRRYGVEDTAKARRYWIHGRRLLSRS